MCGGGGAALILYSIFTYSKATPFPGFYALVPVLGTVLVILFATHQTIIGRFIGNKAFVAVGLISYSAYLWHQPLFAFSRHRNLAEPSHTFFLILSALALILAYFTWRYVEAPFRRKDHIGRKKIFAFALLGSLAFCIFGAIGHMTDGNFLKRTTALDEHTRPNHGLHVDCINGYTNSPHCATSPKPEVLLWGDSYMMHWVQGLLASNPDIRMIQQTLSACSPVLGIASKKENHLYRKKCLSHNDSVFEYLASSKSIRYVVLSSPFEQIVNNASFVVTHDGRTLKGKEVALQYMLNTISKLRALGKIPVIISPPPKNGKDIGQCLKKQ